MGASELDSKGGTSARASCDAAVGVVVDVAGTCVGVITPVTTTAVIIVLVVMPVAGVVITDLGLREGETCWRSWEWIEDGIRVDLSEEAGFGPGVNLPSTSTSKIRVLEVMS